MTNKEYPNDFGSNYSGLWQLPYGSPNGSLSPPATTISNTTNSTVATTYAGILTVNRSGLSQVGWYSDIDTTNERPADGGTLLLGNGWKVINFTWLNNWDGLNSSDVSVGAWVETGREVLARRGFKDYLKFN
jgi:hypothetical protein